MKKYVLTLIILISLLPANVISFVSAYPKADGNPFDWIYDNVKYLDGHDDIYWFNDGDDYARDLIAFYYSENPDTITMRIDVMELDIGEEVNANWYILMDFAPGGSSSLPDGLQGSTSMQWDLAVAIYDSTNYNIYLPNGSKVNDALVAISLNAEYDFIEIELYKSKIPNFPAGGQIHFQVLSAKDFNNIVVDSIPNDLSYYFTSDNNVGTAKIAFVHHGNQHIAYSDAEICGGVGTGYDEILRVHEEYNVPVSLHLSGVLLENLVWNDYVCGDMDFLDTIKRGVQEGWIDILTSAYGQHIMPFFPVDVNIKSLAKENELIWELFQHNPKIAWVPERVWETKLSDSDPYNGVKSDPWEYFNAVDPADGEPYSYAVILDEDTHGSDVPNPRKIYKLPGYNLRVFFIDNILKDDTYGNMLKVKKHLLDYALSSDQQQILLYADDWEKAAGVANWPTSPDAYKYLVRYVAAHPWIQAEKLITYLSWNLENGWGYGGEYWPKWGTYSQIGGLSGYGGTGDVNGDGNPDRNAWYKDWAINYYPYNCPKSAGALWWDVYQELQALRNNGVNNNLVELAWITFLSNLYETGWHDGLVGPISGWEKEITSHMRHALPYAYGAWWLNNQEKPLMAYWKNVDGDNDEEIVIQNDKLYAVIDPIGGRIGWLFDSQGHVIIGNSMALWSGTEGDYNDGNHVWGLSDAHDNGTYEHDYYTIRIIQDGSNGEVIIRAKHSSGFYKEIRLKKGWQYLKISYKNVTSNIYIKTGFSPGLSDMLKNGKSNIQRIWIDDGKIAGYYDNATDTLGAYIINNPVQFNRGEDWRTLTIVDEIKIPQNASFYLYAGPKNDELLNYLETSLIPRGEVFTLTTPTQNSTVIVYYNASEGPLKGSSQVYIHFGHDGWQEIQDLAMTNEGNNLWSVAIEIENWSSIDMAFYNEREIWDNNGGKDFKLAVSPSNIPLNVASIVDGDPSDWEGNSEIIPYNSAAISKGEWIWRDALNDIHTSTKYILSVDNYDLNEIRLKADDNYLYFLVKLRDLQNLGEFGSPVLILLINTGTGTNTIVDAESGVLFPLGWDYEIIIDLSREWIKDEQILTGTDDALMVYNGSHSDISNGNDYFIASIQNDIVELAIPKNKLGNPNKISLNVLVLQGDSSGGSVPLSSPAVADLISVSSTDAEVSDATVDYYEIIDISQVPFFSDFGLMFIIVLLFLGAFTRR